MTRAIRLPRAEGDRAGALAFEHFFDETCHMVVGLVTATTGDVAAAEDAVQEAYVRAHKRWDRVSTLERPDLWVAQVATRIAISDWRRHRRETALVDPVAVAVNDSVTRLWVRWGLESLSPKQRLAMILHHVHGHRIDDVAALSGSSSETVRTHLKRARSRLRRLLSAEEDDE